MVTAPITAPSRSSRAEWSWSSIRMSNRTSGNRPNTAVNHVDIESALTAIAIRVRSDEPPPISASASDSNSAVWAASRSSGTPAGVATQGFSRRTSTWPTRCSSALIRWLTADGVTCSRVRGGIEAAVLDHRGECGELLTIDLHISNANAYEESLAVLIHAGALASTT